MFFIFFFFFYASGITIPSQDILYNALGALIKERKVYHTGEGYFIVTPQTYFITNAVVREKTWWAFSSDDPPSPPPPPPPPPITYLLSNDTGAESSPSLPVAHCKSCSCFNSHQTSGNVAPALLPATLPPSPVPEQNSVSVSVSECTGKSLKWPRPLDHKPAVQHQSTSTAADYQASEVSKTTGTTNATGRKDKDSKPGRKFGLSLFWRNAAKKEKPRKEYASFSGQFPPEEWPVRDEDDLNNLPRDLEHAIIKRINPELTVDNLTRHTVLMKKLEERRDRGVDRVLDKGLDASDKGVDRGMSTEILSYSRSKHHYSSKAGKRCAHKASRSRRRAHSSRDKSREKEKGKNKAPVGADDCLERGDFIPPRLRLEIPVDEPDRVEECGAAEEKCLYKKRIENPFQTHPGKESEVDVPQTRDRQPRGLEVREGGVLGVGRRLRTGYRSKSWDPHRAKSNMEDGEQATRSPTSVDRDLSRRERAGEDVHADVKPARELPPDYSCAYPQSSTLRMDDKARQQREVEDLESWEGQSKNGTLGVLDHQPTVGLPHDPPAPRPRPPSHSPRHSNPLQLACEDPVLQQPEELRPIAMETAQRRTVNCQEQPDGLPSTGAHGFFEDDRWLYQRGEEQEEEDACSSLCLNEEDIADWSEAPPAGVSKYHSQQASSKHNQPLAHCYVPSGPPAHLTSLPPSRDAAFKDPTSPAVQRGASAPPRRGDSRWRLGLHTQRTGSAGPRGDPGPRPSVSVQGGGQPEANLDLDAASPSDVPDESIFDYCQTSEMDSDADTVRKSTDEGDSQSVQWAAEAEKEQGHALGGTCAPRSQRPSPGHPAGGVRSEVGETENQSITGDSGIDSPR